MNGSAFEDPYELINAAEYLPYGPAMIAAYEHAIAVADAADDLDAASQARVGHVKASTFGGASDRALVSFAWCLARHDEDPYRFPDMLWEYKWIAGNLPDFASVPDAKIQELLDDMERRFQPIFGSEVAVNKLRMIAASTQGRLDEVPYWFDRWRASLKVVGYGTRLSDCQACDINQEGWQLAQLGHHEEAIAIVEPILNSEVWCSTVPHGTFAWLLRSMAATGRFDEAAELQPWGYELIKNNPDFLVSVAEHADHLRWTGATELAVGMIDRHWPWLASVLADTERVDFLATAARVFAAAGDEQRAAAALAQAYGHADALDRRNGNGHWRSVCDRDPYEGYAAPAA
jgi:hypothetical protein